jgi:hypothetical protein
MTSPKGKLLLSAHSSHRQVLLHTGMLLLAALAAVIPISQPRILEDIRAALGMDRVLLGGIVVIFLGILILYSGGSLLLMVYYYRSRLFVVVPETFKLYEDGFIFKRRGGQDAYVWSELDSYKHHVYYTLNNTGPLSTMTFLTLSTTDGKRYVLDLYWSNLKQLSELLPGLTTAAMLPSIFQQLERGHAVEFGHFRVLPTGLEVRGRTAQWSDIADVRIDDKGMLVIKVQGDHGRTKTFARTLFGAIPNPFAFTTVVGQFLRPQYPAEGQDQPPADFRPVFTTYSESAADARRGMVRVLGLVVGGIILSVAVAAVLIATNGLNTTLGEGIFEGVVTALVTGIPVALLLLLTLLRRVVLRGTETLTLTEEGLTYQRRRRGWQYTWLDVVSLVQPVLPNPFNALSSGHSPNAFTLTLTFTDGVQLVLQGFSDMQQIAETIKAMTIEPLHSRTSAALERGEPVQFGVFTATADGIQFRGRLLPWSDMHSILLTQDRVIIQQHGQPPTEFADAAMGDIPNAFVLLELARQVMMGERSEHKSSSDARLKSSLSEQVSRGEV